MCASLWVADRVANLGRSGTDELSGGGEIIDLTHHHLAHFIFHALDNFSGARIFDLAYFPAHLEPGAHLNAGPLPHIGDDRIAAGVSHHAFDTDASGWQGARLCI